MSSVLFSSGSFNRNNQGRADLRRVETRVEELEKKLKDLQEVFAMLQKTRLLESLGLLGLRVHKGLLVHRAHKGLKVRLAHRAHKGLLGHQAHKAQLGLRALLGLKKKLTV